MPQSTKGSSAPARRRLGRGLTSLISAPVRIDAASEPSERAAGNRPAAAPSKADSEELRRIAVAEIAPNPYQPRKHFDEASLDELAASIREAGMMQPVVVRPGAGGRAGYELIAGERRWRAAAKIGLDRIPAIIRDVDHQTAAEWALIENIQRADINCIERAEAFQRLAAEFSLTHQEIADRVGLNRASVTNHLRLLEHDDETRAAVAAGELSMGHARALLAIPNSRRGEIARRAVREGWSVRELERRVQRLAAGSEPKEPHSASTQRVLPAHLEDLQRKLGEHLGSKVVVRPGRKKGAGRLTIDFYSLDEFEGILARLGFEAN